MSRYEDAVARMDAALAAMSVHIGFPEERDALARKLVASGVTVAQVEAVRATVGSSRSPGAALAKVLSDPDETKKRAADVVRCRGLQQQASGPPAGQGQGQVHHARDDAWNQRKAYALVVADGKTAKTVAALMGATVEQVEQWVRAERELREQDSPSARRRAADDESPEERLQRFRDMMAARRPRP